MTVKKIGYNILSFFRGLSDSVEIHNLAFHAYRELAWKQTDLIVGTERTRALMESGVSARRPQYADLIPQDLAVTSPQRWLSYHASQILENDGMAYDGLHMKPRPGGSNLLVARDKRSSQLALQVEEFDTSDTEWRLTVISVRCTYECNTLALSILESQEDFSRNRQSVQSPSRAYLVPAAMTGRREGPSTTVIG
ncbi:hypothetical protein HETIRDRAFT_429239 [Heterobasidion irregulare TC 32-1]|uniref:Uncharacterized protein n=1 Tax=Heterobasidion irregulare (strain TC 32-1) TaxID=747525 RepID=W4JX75_HETIT|nr:uncharacterized protein HETIRDRAFT_429239 [Heterobasidion irregulare TC 32-1]ETW78162.1 hypothetical protein HETIRDRAFT_429239 [Heterobasidion irregulare TC 32-1]